MTKEQYLKVIETVIKSPRNDLQKIGMLKYSFEAYVEDCNKKLMDSGIVGEFVGIPIIGVPALISWLNDQKYTTVDETSDTMTEEFEREHQWELSRNCFINKMIRQLKELK